MVVCLAPAPTATAGFGSIVMVSRGGQAWTGMSRESCVFLGVAAFKNFQLKFLSCTMVGFYYVRLLHNATACC